MFTITTHKLIDRVIKMLVFFGMWHKATDSIYLKLGKKLINSIVLVSLFASLASGALLSNDMNEKVYLSAATVAAGLLVVKLIYMLLKQREILTFLNGICVHTVADANEFNVVTIKLNNFARFIYVNYFSMSMAMFLFAIFTLPFFSSERRLPLNIGFPLDWRKSLFAYCLAHSFVIVAVVFALAVTFFTIIYWYIMFNCSIKYQIFGNKLRELGSEMAKNDNRKPKSIVVEDLIKLIGTHRSIQA